MDEKGKLKEPFQRQFELYEHYVKFIKSHGTGLYACLNNSYKFWKHVLWLNPRIIHETIHYLNLSKEDQKGFEINHLFSAFRLSSCPYQRKVRFTSWLYLSSYDSSSISLKEEIRKAEADIYRFEMAAIRLITKDYLLWKEMVSFANLPFLLETINYSIYPNKDLHQLVRTKFVNCSEESYVGHLKNLLQFVLEFIINSISNDMKPFEMSSMIDKSKKIFEKAHQSFASSQFIQYLIQSAIKHTVHQTIDGFMFSMQLNLEKKIDDLILHSSSKS